VPILQNQSLNIKVTRRAYATTQACLLASSKLAEYNAIAYPDQRKISGGFEKPEYDNFSYEYLIESGGFPMINRNTLVVRWGKKSDEKLELITYAVAKKSK